MLIKNDKSWLSEETVQARFEFYNSGRPGIPRVSPISELRDTYDEYQDYLERENCGQMSLRLLVTPPVSIAIIVMLMQPTEA